jgi:uncharacterized protein
MKCPICRNPVQWQDNPYRPFCSERCKMIDLDHWLSERYRIPVTSENDEDPEPGPASGTEDQIA